MNDLYFKGEEHRQFFFSCLKQCKNYDAYHQAFFYLTGVCEDTRGNIAALFDFAEDRIKPEGLDGGWQTGGTRRLSRLAMNLWNGYTEDGREALASPYELFDCGYAPYMLEGIKLRYPEYCRDLAPARSDEPKTKGQER